MLAKSWIEFIRIALDILPSIYGCLENQIKMPYSPKIMGPAGFSSNLLASLHSNRRPSGYEPDAPPG